MFFRKLFAVLFWASCVSSAPENPLILFYEELNLFRQDPVGYAESRGYHMACVTSGNNNRLERSMALEAASRFHAESLARSDCPVIGHSTCAKYCYMFGGCSYIDRIKSFLGPSVKTCEINEVLVKGVKNPYRLMEVLLSSEGHCLHISHDDMDVMGAYIVHIEKTVFVLSLVKFC